MVVTEVIAAAENLEEMTRMVGMGKINLTAKSLKNFIFPKKMITKTICSMQGYQVELTSISSIKFQ